jgi:arabinofuranosyltransferase
MENFFNFILLLIFITILIFLFSLFYVKENYKYFLLFFSIIILTLCFDLVATGLQKFYIVYFLFPVFFVLTFYLFFKQKFLINDMEYQKQISLITGLFFIYYLLLIFRTAWISDDAYITFRVADNFVNGYGLRWNVEERVQAFTNTLFLFTFIPLYFVFRDAYFSGLILNFVFSILTILLLRKLIDSKEKFLLVISGLCFSKAYIDFSTSGLENSLTFFLLTLFLYVIFKIDESDKRYTYLFLIFSALFLNRPDAVLIIIPVILYILYKEKPTFKYIFIGLIPLFLWEIFSIIYFGFPLPNTFYAKLITGINRLELIKQGGVYFFTNFITDPVTLFIIFSGIILNIVYFKKIKNAFLTFLNAGILSYLLYLLSSGGDFMTGRFFSFLLPILLFIIVSIIDNIYMDSYLYLFFYGFFRHIILYGI